MSTVAGTARGGGSARGARTARPAAGGVQSVHRALDLLEIVSAQAGPMPVGDIASGAGLPVATAHRLVRTLVDRGYLRQLPDRTYALGFRLVALGEAANRLVGVDAQEVLADLVGRVGESVNLAVLAGDRAQYVAQAPSRYAMRMFTEVGRRVDLHCTGVGKVLLAQLDPAEAERILRRRGLTGYTAYTLTTRDALLAALDRIRSEGFAIDEQEQELGVRCVAVPVVMRGASWMALSVSGPTARMTDEAVDRALPLLRAAAGRLGAGGPPDPR